MIHIGIAQTSLPVQGTEAPGAVPEQPRDSEGGEGGGGGAAAQGHADGQVARGDQGPRARGRDRSAGMDGGRKAAFHDKSIIPEMYMREIRILSYFIRQLN